MCRLLMLPSQEAEFQWLILSIDAITSANGGATYGSGVRKLCHYKRVYLMKSGYR